MSGRIGVGDTHRDQHLVERVHGVADPPLAPVEHVFVAVTFNGQLHVGCI